MKPLFEAKALFEDQYVLYNVYRIEPEKYKAQLITTDERDYTAAPNELVVSKTDGNWQSQDNGEFDKLVSTLGIEIDAFNNGYGALLGRIGIS